jgi:hypothetical protein
MLQPDIGLSFANGQHVLENKVGFPEFLEQGSGCGHWINFVCISCILSDICLSYYTSSYSFIFWILFIYLFWWYKGLNSGLQTCKADTVPLEPHFQSIFLLWLFWRWGLTNYLPKLALSHSPLISVSHVARAWATGTWPSYAFKYSDFSL